MKFSVHATATISLYAEVEAMDREDALRVAESLEMPDLCIGCSSQNNSGEAWQPAMDAAPEEIRVEDD
jgi:hypothetical protein